MVLLEATKDVQSLVTFLSLHLPNDVSLTFCDESTIFELTVNSQQTECTLYLSYNASACLQ
jgi:hypothetical protein